MLEGMPEIAEEALDVPVRRGAPQQLAGLTDAIATSQFGTTVGLTLYGARERAAAPQYMTHPFPFIRMSNLLKNWFSELFERRPG